MTGLRTLVAATLALVLLGMPALAGEVLQARPGANPSCCPLGVLMGDCPMVLGAGSCPELQLSNCQECCAASSLPALPTAPTQVPLMSLELRCDVSPTAQERARALATDAHTRGEVARLRLAERRFATGSSALLSIFLI